VSSKRIVAAEKLRAGRIRWRHTGSAVRDDLEIANSRAYWRDSLKLGVEFADRTDKLFQLTRVLDEAAQTDGKTSLRSSGCHRMAETGRLWERCLGCDRAESTPERGWPAHLLSRIKPPVSDGVPISLANLANMHDYRDFPDHRELLSRYAGQRILPAEVFPLRRSALKDTTEAGIDFAYVNGSDPLTEEARSRETPGGPRGDSRTRTRIENRARMFEQNGGGSRCHRLRRRRPARPVFHAGRRMETRLSRTDAGRQRRPTAYSGTSPASRSST